MSTAFWFRCLYHVIGHVFCRDYRSCGCAYVSCKVKWSCLWQLILFYSFLLFQVKITTYSAICYFFVFRTLIFLTKNSVSIPCVLHISWANCPSSLAKDCVHISLSLLLMKYLYFFVFPWLCDACMGLHFGDDVGYWFILRVYTSTLFWLQVGARSTSWSLWRLNSLHPWNF